MRIASPALTGVLAAVLIAASAVPVLALSSSASSVPTLAADQAVSVTGSYTCCTLVAEGTATTTADGITQVRGEGFRMTLTMSDPRLSGTLVSMNDSDDFGPPGTDGLEVGWGTTRIENADGAWEGPFTSASDASGGSVATAWLVGTGAYEGLSAYLRTTWPAQSAEGMIFPGDPPPLR